MENVGWQEFSAPTLPKIQQEIAEWVLRLAELSEVFDRTGGLSPEQYEEFLHLTFTLHLLLQDAVQMRFADNEAVLWAVNALALFREDRDAYVTTYELPHKIYAVYFDPRTKEVTPKLYTDYKKFEKDLEVMKKKEFELREVAVLPGDEVVRLVARALVVTARDYGILAFQIHPKPSHKVAPLKKEGGVRSGGLDRQVEQ